VLPWRPIAVTVPSSSPLTASSVGVALEARVLEIHWQRLHASPLARRHIAPPLAPTR
jgi:hypothetical protein|tara:strand:+ start:214 stop:384 length:171 start_codon:yes stop_codon:yes gene_type:complete